jgi:cysteine-rich repeat protein
MSFLRVSLHCPYFASFLSVEPNPRDTFTFRLFDNGTGVPRELHFIDAEAVRGDLVDLRSDVTSLPSRTLDTLSLALQASSLRCDGSTTAWTGRDVDGAPAAGTLLPARPIVTASLVASLRADRTLACVDASSGSPITSIPLDRACVGTNGDILSVIGAGWHHVDGSWVDEESKAGQLSVLSDASAVTVSGSWTPDASASRVCAVLSGATSSSACAHACGDGRLSGNEACDDGNLVNGDGCSDACAVEPVAGHALVATMPLACPGLGSTFLANIPCESGLLPIWASADPFDVELTLSGTLGAGVQQMHLLRVADTLDLDPIVTDLYDQAVCGEPDGDVLMSDVTIASAEQGVARDPFCPAAGGLDGTTVVEAGSRELATLSYNWENISTTDGYFALHSLVHARKVVVGPGLTEARLSIAGSESVCGDGIVGGAEECDTGNVLDEHCLLCARPRRGLECRGSACVYLPEDSSTLRPEPVGARSAWPWPVVGSSSTIYYGLGGADEEVRLVLERFVAADTTRPDFTLATWPLLVPGLVHSLANGTVNGDSLGTRYDKAASCLSTDLDHPCAVRETQTAGGILQMSVHMTDLATVEATTDGALQATLEFDSPGDEGAYSVLSSSTIVFVTTPPSVNTSAFPTGGLERYDPISGNFVALFTSSNTSIASLDMSGIFAEDTVGIDTIVVCAGTAVSASNIMPGDVPYIAHSPVVGPIPLAESANSYYSLTLKARSRVGLTATAPFYLAIDASSPSRSPTAEGISVSGETSYDVPEEELGFAPAGREVVYGTQAYWSSTAVTLDWPGAGEMDPLFDARSWPSDPEDIGSLPLPRFSSLRICRHTVGAAPPSGGDCISELDELTVDSIDAAGSFALPLAFTSALGTGFHWFSLEACTFVGACISESSVWFAVAPNSIAPLVFSTPGLELPLEPGSFYTAPGFVELSWTGDDATARLSPIGSQSLVSPQCSGLPSLLADQTSLELTNLGCATANANFTLQVCRTLRAAPQPQVCETPLKFVVSSDVPLGHGYRIAGSYRRSAGLLHVQTDGADLTINWDAFSDPLSSDVETYVVEAVSSCSDPSTVLHSQSIAASSVAESLSDSVCATCAYCPLDARLADGSVPTGSTDWTPPAMLASADACACCWVRFFTALGVCDCKPEGSTTVFTASQCSGFQMGCPSTQSDYPSWHASTYDLTGWTAIRDLTTLDLPPPSTRPSRWLRDYSATIPFAAVTGYVPHIRVTAVGAAVASADSFCTPGILLDVVAPAVADGAPASMTIGGVVSAGVTAASASTEVVGPAHVLDIAWAVEDTQGGVRMVMVAMSGETEDSSSFAIEWLAPHPSTTGSSGPLAVPTDAVGEVEIELTVVDGAGNSFVDTRLVWVDETPPVALSLDALVEGELMWLAVEDAESGLAEIVVEGVSYRNLSARSADERVSVPVSAGATPIVYLVNRAGLTTAPTFTLSPDPSTPILRLGRVGTSLDGNGRVTFDWTGFDDDSSLSATLVRSVSNVTVGSSFAMSGESGNAGANPFGLSAALSSALGGSEVSVVVVACAGDGECGVVRSPPMVVGSDPRPISSACVLSLSHGIATTAATSAVRLHAELPLLVAAECTATTVLAVALVGDSMDADTDVYLGAAGVRWLDYFPQRIFSTSLDVSGTIAGSGGTLRACALLATGALACSPEAAVVPEAQPTLQLSGLTASGETAVSAAVAVSDGAPWQGRVVCVISAAADARRIYARSAFSVTLATAGSASIVLDASSVPLGESANVDCTGVDSDTGYTTGSTGPTALPALGAATHVVVTLGATVGVAWTTGDLVADALVDTSELTGRRRRRWAVVRDDGSVVIDWFRDGNGPGTTVSPSTKAFSVNAGSDPSILPAGQLRVCLRIASVTGCSEPFWSAASLPTSVPAAPARTVCDGSLLPATIRCTPAEGGVTGGVVRYQLGLGGQVLDGAAASPLFAAHSLSTPSSMAEESGWLAAWDAADRLVNFTVTLSQADVGSWRARTLHTMRPAAASVSVDVDGSVTASPSVSTPPADAADVAGAGEATTRWLVWCKPGSSCLPVLSDLSEVRLNTECADVHLLYASRQTSLLSNPGGGDAASFLGWGLSSLPLGTLYACDAAFRCTPSTLVPPVATINECVRGSELFRAPLSRFVPVSAATVVVNGDDFVSTLLGEYGAASLVPTLGSVAGTMASDGTMSFDWATLVAGGVQPGVPASLAINLDSVVVAGSTMSTVILDDSPPKPAEVFLEGAEESKRDGSTRTRLRVSWHGVIDVESGVDALKVCVYKCTDPDGVITCVAASPTSSVATVSVATAADVTCIGARVEATNGAGLTSHSVSSREVQPRGVGGTAGAIGASKLTVELLNPETEDESPVADGSHMLVRVTRDASAINPGTYLYRALADTSFDLVLTAQAGSDTDGSSSIVVAHGQPYPMEASESVDFHALFLPFVPPNDVVEATLILTERGNPRYRVTSSSTLSVKRPSPLAKFTDPYYELFDDTLTDWDALERYGALSLSFEEEQCVRIRFPAASSLQFKAQDQLVSLSWQLAMSAYGGPASDLGLPVVEATTRGVPFTLVSVDEECVDLDESEGAAKVLANEMLTYPGRLCTAGSDTNCAPRFFVFLRIHEVHAQSVVRDYSIQWYCRSDDAYATAAVGVTTHTCRFAGIVPAAALQEAERPSEWCSARYALDELLAVDEAYGDPACVARPSVDPASLLNIVQPGGQLYAVTGALGLAYSDTFLAIGAQPVRRQTGAYSSSSGIDGGRAHIQVFTGDPRMVVDDIGDEIYRLQSLEFDTTLDEYMVPQAVAAAHGMLVFVDGRDMYTLLDDPLLDAEVSMDMGDQNRVEVLDVKSAFFSLSADRDSIGARMKLGADVVLITMLPQWFSQQGPCPVGENGGLTSEASALGLLRLRTDSERVADMDLEALWDDPEQVDRLCDSDNKVENPEDSWMGYGVDISRHGRLVVAGAPRSRGGLVIPRASSWQDDVGVVLFLRKSMHWNDDLPYEQVAVSNLVDGNKLGSAVSVSSDGRTVIVSEPGTTPPSVHVVTLPMAHFSEAALWDLEIQAAFAARETIVSEDATDAFFGRSVSLSPDGLVLAVGGNNTVSLFYRNIASCGFSPVPFVSFNSDYAEGDDAGYNVVLSKFGEKLFVSAPHYLYDENDDDYLKPNIQTIGPWARLDEEKGYVAEYDITLDRLLLFYDQSTYATPRARTAVSATMVDFLDSQYSFGVRHERDLAEIECQRSCPTPRGDTVAYFAPSPVVASSKFGFTAIGVAGGFRDKPYMGLFNGDTPNGWLLDGVKVAHPRPFAGSLSNVRTSWFGKAIALARDTGFVAVSAPHMIRAGDVYGSVTVYFDATDLTNTTTFDSYQAGTPEFEIDPDNIVTRYFRRSEDATPTNVDELGASRAPFMGLSLAFSDDGHILAAGGMGYAFVWELDTGAMEYELVHVAQGVTGNDNTLGTTVAVSHDGSVVYVGRHGAKCRGADFGVCGDVEVYRSEDFAIPRRADDFGRFGNERDSQGDEGTRAFTTLRESVLTPMSHATYDADEFGSAISVGGLESELALVGSSNGLHLFRRDLCTGGYVEEYAWSIDDTVGTGAMSALSRDGATVVYVEDRASPPAVVVYTWPWTTTPATRIDLSDPPTSVSFAATEDGEDVDILVTFNNTAAHQYVRFRLTDASSPSTREQTRVLYDAIPVYTCPMDNSLLASFATPAPGLERFCPLREDAVATISQYRYMTPSPAPNLVVDDASATSQSARVSFSPADPSEVVFNYCEMRVDLGAWQSMPCGPGAASITDLRLVLPFEERSSSVAGVSDELARVEIRGCRRVGDCEEPVRADVALFDHVPHYSSPPEVDAVMTDVNELTISWSTAEYPTLQVRLSGAVDATWQTVSSSPTTFAPHAFGAGHGDVVRVQARAAPGAPVSVTEPFTIDGTQPVRGQVTLDLLAQAVFISGFGDAESGLTRGFSLCLVDEADAAHVRYDTAGGLFLDPDVRPPSSFVNTNVAIHGRTENLVDFSHRFTGTMARTFTYFGDFGLAVTPILVGADGTTIVVQGKPQSSPGRYNFNDDVDSAGIPVPAGQVLYAGVRVSSGRHLYEQIVPGYPATRTDSRLAFGIDAGVEGTLPCTVSAVSAGDVYDLSSIWHTLNPTSRYWAYVKVSNQLGMVVAASSPVVQMPDVTVPTWSSTELTPVVGPLPADAPHLAFPSAGSFGVQPAASQQPKTAVADGAAARTDATLVSGTSPLPLSVSLTESTLTAVAVADSELSACVGTSLWGCQLTEPSTALSWDTATLSAAYASSSGLGQAVPLWCVTVHAATDEGSAANATCICPFGVVCDASLG